ncbi:Citramalyl-CoA lyase, mitochondrial [Pseudolycoriella hygida]|uniref:Citramalyl-CoA lyase, mitochondrial n=1 Tax=Pseudolycoriella hygida TaxID=35572 RepID=A0A9Q0N3S9_9DIPT|nr:Citramalyl-CoA lyase, mitochondrial [Pseudolycoriella hygida]
MTTVSKPARVSQQNLYYHEIEEFIEELRNELCFGFVWILIENNDEEDRIHVDVPDIEKLLICDDYLRNNSNFIPRRALLYVPGDDVRKISKIKEFNVDCLVLDCEDGVAVNKKAKAREEISAFLSNGFGNGKSEIAVRLNSIESGMFEEDLRSIVCNKYPTTIVLPKLNSPDEAEFFTESLKKHVSRDNLNAPINLIFISESCQSILSLPRICESLVGLSKSSGIFELAAIIFGSDDFCASLGATRTKTSLEILYARQRLVLVAKAYGLQAIDMVDIDDGNLSSTVRHVNIMFKFNAVEDVQCFQASNEDLIGLKTSSEVAASFGYTGKQIIHPSQIEIVQQAFLPSKDKLLWALQLLEEFAKFQSEGKGVFVFRNQMIDMPTVRQAKNIVNGMKKIEKTGNKTKQ